MANGELKQLKRLANQMKLNATLPLIIDYLSDFIIGMDDEGAIMFMNKSFLNALRYREIDIKYANYLDFVHPEDLSKTRSAFNIARNTGTISNFRNRYISKNEKVLNLNWRQVFTIDGITFAISEKLK